MSDLEVLLVLDMERWAETRGLSMLHQSGSRLIMWSGSVEETWSAMSIEASGSLWNTASRDENDLGAGRLWTMAGRMPLTGAG